MPNLPYHSSSATAASSPFGGITVTIAAVDYRAMNWNPQKETREIPRNDVNGDEAEFMLRAMPTRQSGLRLQSALASTAVPTLGTEFTVTALVYVITKVGQPKEEGDWWAIELDYRSKILPTD